MTARPTPVEIMARAMQPAWDGIDGLPPIEFDTIEADELARAALAALEGAGFVVVRRDANQIGDAQTSGSGPYHVGLPPFTRAP